MSRSNLASPNTISNFCRIDDLDIWLADELKSIEDATIRTIVRTVCKKLGRFIQFPERPLLLWQGCDRIKPKGEKQKIHLYPEELKSLAKQKKIRLDKRPNGPAIASFLLAEGDRPIRFGSENAWSIHHLYSGKYISPGKERTLHATQDGNHFTQSAGLIAAHPIADAMCDEFPAFAWRLRAESFLRFGYDPDGVFAKRHSKLGFAKKRCKIAYSDQ
ncbi:MAG: hypothetical protein GXP24_08440 [Planctomycetes bacterium]|nr:hypothetical protein [Planctomycetota bacterium]